MFTESQASLYAACAKLSPRFRVEHEIFQVNVHGLPPAFPVIAAYAGDRPLAKVQAQACTCGDPRCLDVAFTALLNGSLLILRQSN